MTAQARYRWRNHLYQRSVRGRTFRASSVPHVCDRMAYRYLRGIYWDGCGSPLWAQKNSRSHSKCFGCDKVGHIRRNCPTNPWSKQKDKGKKSSEEWILGSGCTKTFERNHFLDLRSGKGSVTIANGESLQVHGVGTEKCEKVVCKG